MACRKINYRYDQEGYIIKYIDWDDAFFSGVKFPLPEESSSQILQNIFKEINLNKISQQAIIQQYNEIYIWNEANREQKELLAPQVKIRYSLCDLPEIYYPKFIPLVQESKVWSLNESDLKIFLGTRLQLFGINFCEYQKFIKNVINLCEDFNLREDDIILNPSNIGYHSVLGLRVIDYGLIEDRGV